MSRKKTTPKRTSAVRKSYELRSGSKKVAVVKQSTKATTSKGKQRVTKKSNVKDEHHCSICLNTHNYKQKKQMICGHTFHTRCINSWVKVSQSCPICRKPVKEQYTCQQCQAEAAEQERDSSESTMHQNPPQVAVFLAALRIGLSTSTYGPTPRMQLAAKYNV